MGSRLIGSPDDAVYRNTAELQAATLVRGIQTLLGIEEPRMRLTFGFPEPAHGDRYREVLGDDVRFDGEATLLLAHRSHHEQEFPTYDRVMHELYGKQIWDDFSLASPRADPVREIRRVLASSSHEFPTMVQMSRTLNLSERSLRRQLKERDSSYHALVSEAKMNKAVEYLTRSKLSIEEVAARLGFSDDSNFRRAFRGWFGESPIQYRRRG